MQSATERLRGKGRAHWTRRACALGVSVVACYLVISCAPLPFIQSWWGEIPWNDRWNRRQRMADWLIYSQSLIGSTRAQVVAKLGEPPSTDYFRDWSMVYNLGPERGFMSIDSEWLVVRISEDGRVEEARIVRD
jgi:hypothetical protein